MNKNDLIDAVAERTALAKSDAARAVEAVLGADHRRAAEGRCGGAVGLRHASSPRPGRPGPAAIRAPARPSPIPASKVPGFKAGKGLKDAVN